MLWLQILCPAIDYDDKCELQALCCLWCVCFGGDIPVLWWSTDSEWNKCEGSVTIFTLNGAQMAENGDLLLSLYGRQLTTLIFNFTKQLCKDATEFLLW